MHIKHLKHVSVLLDNSIVHSKVGQRSVAVSNMGLPFAESTASRSWPFEWRASGKLPSAAIAKAPEGMHMITRKVSTSGQAKGVRIPDFRLPVVKPQTQKQQHILNHSGNHAQLSRLPSCPSPCPICSCRQAATRES